ncbi:MAG: hypothetical protein DRN12_06210 [Thermoplasmata archaeon]|nr:MAG: hypothetical protein DRN12_06210 [Thermoplasmata archaeon]
MHIETIRFLVIFLCDGGGVLATAYLSSYDFIPSLIFTIILILTGYFLGAYDSLHRPSYGLRVSTQIILLFTFIISVVVERLTGLPMRMIHHLPFWITQWLLVNIFLVPLNILLRHLFPIPAILVGRREYHRYQRVAHLLGFRVKELVPFSKLGFWLNAHSDEFGKVHDVEVIILTPLPKEKLPWVKLMAERYFIQFIIFRSALLITYAFGYLFQHLTVSPLYGINRRIKRAVDFVLVVILLSLSWPIFLVIAVLIKLDSEGPVFFTHNRIGRELNYFKLYKFRTMFNDAERRLKEILESDPKLREEFLRTFKIRNDPRVTKIGAILRKWSLDELPQLINVLKGEMSLVGYRPIITDEIDIYKKRSLLVFRTTPGITGQWQISGRSDTTYLERVRLDLEYIRHWSYLKDLKILIKTIPAVIKRKGAY